MSTREFIACHSGLDPEPIRLTRLTIPFTCAVANSAPALHIGSAAALRSARCSASFAVNFCASGASPLHPSEKQNSRKTEHRKRTGLITQN